MAAPRIPPELSNLYALADRMEPGIRRAFLVALQSLRDLSTERALVDALARGDYDGAVSVLFGGGRGDAAFSEFMVRARTVLTESAAIGAAAATRSLSLIPSAAPYATFSAGGRPVVAVRFDVVHPAVTDAIRRFDTTLMRTVQESAREGVRATIQAGLESGLPPAKIARQIRSSVGLGPRQAQAVVNYRRYLETGDSAALARDLRDHRFDAAIRRTWAKGESLTREQVDRYVAAYERRYIAWQARTASRTTTLGALREGQRLTWEQAIAEGKVDRANLYKTWHTRLDGRERWTHHEMHRVSVHFDEPWILPDGKVQMVPGEDEFNCRCVAVYRPKLRRVINLEAAA